jgi:hypothetical protein
VEPTEAKSYQFKTTEVCRAHKKALLNYVGGEELPDLLELSLVLEEWRKECVVESSSLKGFESCNYEFLMMETDTRVLLWSIRAGNTKDMHVSAASVLKHLPYFHANCLPYVR